MLLEHGTLHKVLGDVGRTEEAKEKEQEVLKIHTATLGGEHPLMLQSKYSPILLWLAARNVPHEVPALLLAKDGVDLDLKDWSYRTSLSWAAENGHEAVVKLLVDTGKADIDSKDKEYGLTPLSWAAQKGHEAVVRLLESFSSS
jgi:ankyrin repeat protein